MSQQQRVHEGQQAHAILFSIVSSVKTERQTQRQKETIELGLFIGCRAS
jgi:hypothetical protein